MSPGTVVYRLSVQPVLPRTPDALEVESADLHPTKIVTLPLSFFDDDALREIGREWTEALLARAAEQRAEGGGG